MSNLKFIISIIILALLTIIPLMGCTHEPIIPWVPEEGDYRTLAAFMTSYFNNFNQHDSNSSFYAIELRQKRIWSTTEDSIWMYVEQGYSDYDPDYSEYTVYRQRVYNLIKGDNTDQYKSIVYEFKNLSDEKGAVGAWAYNNPLSSFDISKFDKKDGCEVILTKTGEGVYQGGTVGKDCLTSYPNATYATSVVTIDINQGILTSWDRFYNSSDVQVGGASSPYIFDKEENYNSELD
jgi:hypothetical protein